MPPAGCSTTTVWPSRCDCDIDVEFAAGGVGLQGHLHLPDPSAAVVVFAHGSGSSRHSPRNRLVADVLYDAGIGTFLLDLLTPTEENDRRFVFDIDLLARRLAAATTWVRGRHEARAARIGYFGASTGAAAALLAAADQRGARCRRWCRGVVVPTWPWRACPR